MSKESRKARALEKKANPNHNDPESDIARGIREMAEMHERHAQSGAFDIIQWPSPEHLEALTIDVCGTHRSLMYDGRHLAHLQKIEGRWEITGFNELAPPIIEEQWGKSLIELVSDMNQEES